MESAYKRPYNLVTPITEQNKLTDAGRARTLMIACLVAGTASLLAVGIMIYSQSMAMLHARHRVLATQQLAADTRDALATLRDAESDQRSYVLTGNQKFLNGYGRAVQLVHLRLNKLDAETAGNAKQQEYLHKAHLLTDEKLVELKKLTDIRQSEGFASAAEQMKLYAEKGVMNKLRDVFAELQSHQTNVLQEQLADLQYNTRNFLVSFSLAGFTAVCLLGAFGYFMRRYLLDLQNARESISSQRALLSTVLESLSDAVVVADANGDFLIMNPAATELLGRQQNVSPEQWSEAYKCYKADGKTLYPTNDLPLARAIRGEAVDDVEINLRPQAGQSRWISVSGRPLTKEAGFSGGVVVFRDISQKKESEEHLSEFYALLAHELRTPLTSINGSIMLIADGVVERTSDEAMHLLEAAQGETGRMLRLIDTLLDLKKIEEGKWQLNRSPVTPGELVTKVLDALKGMAESEHVRLINQVEFNQNVNCDCDRVQQVLTNLVSNAIKFSKRNGQVIVRAESKGDSEVRFSVCDQGPGISTEDLPKLFRKFQQAQTRQSHRGTGLGLSISKAIVEQHGGEVGIDSELGKGTTVWFTLPIEPKSDS